MAGSTPYYHIGYFDFGDELDSKVNAGLEIDRFLLIDKQMYGMYQIFGDGVIRGWTVFDAGYSEANGISIGVAPGVAVINNIAAQTEFSDMVNGLSPSSTLDIYAILTSDTVLTRRVSFVSSNIDVAVGGQSVHIARIVTGPNSITSIDNSIRDYIFFDQTIFDEIEAHKHRGVPTKIDLEKEIKNQLPGARIENLEASKINQGRLPEDRIPVLNHNELLNTGILTHAGLDSYVQTITTPNLGLLGEVSIVNLLRQTVFLKYKYSDADRYMVNELAMLPDVSLSRQIDFTNSTANIDTTAGCIVGFPFANTDAYFYTANFVLPERVTRGILTARTSTPNNSIITFGVNTVNSTDFDNYQTIIEDRVFNIIQTGINLRVGIQLKSGAGQHDPYIVNFQNFVDFVFINESSSRRNFHWRIRFYNDSFMSDLFTTIYSGNNQEGWVVDDEHNIPSGGYSVGSGDLVTVTYYPDLSIFIPNKVYYLIIDAFDGSSFTSEASGFTFVSMGSTTCDQYSSLPVVKNFAILFEMENKGRIMLNI